MTSHDPATYAKVRRHLGRRDRVLKQLMAAVGPCTLRYEPDRFAMLVRSIISQQISTKAAASISARLQQALGPRGLKPGRVLQLSLDELRAAGLSEAKARAVLDLAEQVHSRAVALKDLHELPDEEVIQRLIPVRGIGRWTAEMFLIFSLGRLDVLPVNDLGLRAGVQQQYGLTALPGRDALTALAEPWRPYRSIATWYFWRSRGFVPQSE